MAKKNKETKQKITINLDDVFNDTENIEWNGLTISIRKKLAFNDMLAFVNDAVNGCFDQKTGEYEPQVQLFIINICILTYYTNLQLPDSTSEMYSLIYGTDILDNVLSVVDNDQLREIVNAVNDKVAYHVHKDVTVTQMKVNKVIDGLELLESKLASLFGNIDEETMDAFVKTIANGDFTEEGMVRAIKKVNSQETDNDKRKVD